MRNKLSLKLNLSRPTTTNYLPSAFDSPTPSPPLSSSTRSSALSSSSSISQEDPFSLDFALSPVPSHTLTFYRHPRGPTMKRRGSSFSRRMSDILDSFHLPNSSHQPQQQHPQQPQQPQPQPQPRPVGVARGREEIQDEEDNDDETDDEDDERPSLLSRIHFPLPPPFRPRNRHQAQNVQNNPVQAEAIAGPSNVYVGEGGGGGHFGGTNDGNGEGDVVKKRRLSSYFIPRPFLSPKNKNQPPSQIQGQTPGQIQVQGPSQPASSSPFRFVPRRPHPGPPPHPPPNIPLPPPPASAARPPAGFLGSIRGRAPGGQAGGGQGIIRPPPPQFPRPPPPPAQPAPSQVAENITCRGLAPLTPAELRGLMTFSFPPKKNNLSSTTTSMSAPAALSSPAPIPAPPRDGGQRQPIRPSPPTRDPLSLVPLTSTVTASGSGVGSAVGGSGTSGGAGDSRARSGEGGNEVEEDDRWIPIGKPHRSPRDAFPSRGSMEFLNRDILKLEVDKAMEKREKEKEESGEGEGRNRFESWERDVRERGNLTEREMVRMEIFQFPSSSTTTTAISTPWSTLNTPSTSKTNPSDLPPSGPSA